MLTRTAAPLELHSDDGELSARFVPRARMLGCSLRHRGEELLPGAGGPRARCVPRAGMRGCARRQRGGGLLGAGGPPTLPPGANPRGGWCYGAGGRRAALARHSPLIATDDNGLPIHGTLMG